MTATANAVQTTLEEAIRLTGAFRELLESESTALDERDGDRIVEIADEKVRLGNRLETLLRDLPLFSTGRDSSDEGKTETDPAIQALSDSLRELQESNRRNGRKVMLQNRQVSEALTVLQGQSGHKDGMTYGADGQARREGHGGRHVQV